MQTEAQRRFSELYKVIRKGLLKKSFTKDSVRGWLKMVGEREGRKAEEEIVKVIDKDDKLKRLLGKASRYEEELMRDIHEDEYEGEEQ